MPEPLLTTKELGRILRKTPKAILQDRYRGSSLPPSIKIGTRLFWRPEDVESWIDAHREADLADVLATVSARDEAPAVQTDAPSEIATSSAGGDRNA